RYRDQWHTMTRTGGVPRLMAHAPEPVLAVHPEDARGIADGALARVSGSHGEAVLRLRHDVGQRRGTAFAPMHWTARNAPTARVNSAVPPAADPVSGQPALKSAQVSLSDFEPVWHGFLLARRDFGPTLAPYCATGLAGQGVWRHEMAGTDKPKHAFARLIAVLNAPGTAWARLEDPAGRLHRGVLLDAGRPVAALFLGPHHHLPPRSWLAARIASGGGGVVPPIAALLAGRAMDGPPPSPTLCVCHGVSQGCVRVAIGAGATDVVAVGEATKAGTGCGSCRPEIAALLAAAVEREALPA
ncbi:MAG: (2Fe-2S)-binding protein, partial [Acetobacteraceae bacterium]|nr:(2Fe-2S)-binding protein [Acetobacteraceae bacterium]